MTTRNASSIEVSSPMMSRTFSFWMSSSVSTLALSSASASSATLRLPAPSKVNGLVTTPTVRAPASRAFAAITGAAPDPVPPPSPAAMKTRSEPSQVLGRG